MSEENLASRLRSTALDVSRMQGRSEIMSRSIDSFLDMVNDLYNWAADSDNQEAALQVLAIIDQYHRKITPTRTSGVKLFNNLKNR